MEKDIAYMWDKLGLMETKKMKFLFLVLRFTTPGAWKMLLDWETIATINFVELLGGGGQHFYL